MFFDFVSKKRALVERLESRQLLSGATVAGAVSCIGGAAPAGETIYLDANNNSVLDSTELSTTTDANGNYQFTNVPAGAYIVRQILASGYTQASPANNYGDHITAAAGGMVGNQNFTDTNGTDTVSGSVLAGGAGLSGVTIYLDANNNSTLDSGELSTTTDSNGNYSFSSVPAGACIVRQVLPSGVQQVTPANNYGDHITVVSGGVLINQNFTDAGGGGTTTSGGGTTTGGTTTTGGGTTTTGGAGGSGATIGGTVLSNGSGLAGVTVYLDANNNSVLDSGELSTTTSSSGVYSFTNVPAGAYIVRQILPTGVSQVTPGSGYGIHLTAAGNATYSGENFTDTSAGASSSGASISGNVFDDANGNGVNDDNDGGLSGLTVYLDLNNSGALATADPQTTTDSFGNYGFTGLAAGAYIVRVIAASGYYQTTPSNNYGQHITVAVGQADTGANFGEQAVAPSPPTAPGVPLASPWIDSDIGSPADAGSATQGGSSGAVITVSGGGADIWGDTDAFNFAYQPLVGDGSIVAQVTAEQASDGWAKAGIMIRETLNDDSREVMLALTDSNGATFEVRSATHNATTQTLVSATTGDWLQLTRIGSTFTASLSVDGVNWTPIGSVTIPMVNNVYVGLAVTAHNNSELATTSFANVSIAATAATASNWSNVATAPMARWESQSFTYDNELYVFGGFIDRSLDATAECDVFNPATNTWSVLTEVPTGGLTHAGTALVGDTVYFAGGDVGTFTDGKTLTATATVLSYDLDNNTWGTIAPLPVAVSCGGLVAINDVLYYYGGINATDTADVSNTYALDLNNPAAAWVAEAPMPNARNHIGYAEINGIAYAIGGQHLYAESTGNVAEVDAYDPATNTWTQVASLPQTWSSFHVSTLVIDNKIVIVGGQTNGGYDGIYQNLIEEYDPAANQWATVGTLPEANEGLSAAYINGEFIAVDGTVDNQGGWALDQTWIDTTLSF